MPHAERTIVIARPPDEVFAFFADAENDRRQVPADIQITALEPGARVAFRGVAGPVRPDGGYEFAPAEGGTAKSLLESGA
jgi:carbon monoxide dehydrogenase subunit G